MPNETQHMIFNIIAVIIFALSVTINEIFAIDMLLSLNWPFESAKVKYKYEIRKPIHDFLFGSNGNICHQLWNIFWAWNEILLGVVVAD